MPELMGAYVKTRVADLRATKKFLDTGSLARLANIWSEIKFCCSCGLVIVLYWGIMTLALLALVVGVLRGQHRDRRR